MPRPTAAQLAYGSATIICSTLAMLLLSGTTTGVGAALIGVAALALGLLVAVTLPLPHGGARGIRAARGARGVRTTPPAAGAPASHPGGETRGEAREARMETPHSAWR
ncbi:hypothetical protein [Streptomyces sp. NPDC093109]|uniref:hypothetical protein n=1 Tax=Streptomyces sp. NPDC093109 TaxID=3154977 RepID=UPI0034506698